MKAITPQVQLNNFLGLSLLGAAGIAYCGGQTGVAELSFSEGPLTSGKEQKSGAAEQDPEIELLRFTDDKAGDLTLPELESIFAANLQGAAKPKAKALARHLLLLSAHYRLSPSLVISVIQAESGFRVRARSKVGARGLMQLLPSTARALAQHQEIVGYRSAEDLYNPFINLTLGVSYLAYLRRRFHNSIHYVAAYNLGPTSVGAMLSAHSFTLGKVGRYVKGIHRNVYQLRGQHLAKVNIASN